MAINTTATQQASATLQNLRAQNQKKTSVKEATSADKKLLSVSRYYGTTNELLKDMYSATKNYNENMFEEAARRGELQTYFALLELNKDNTLSDDFYDPLMFDYDTYIAELYRPEVDDTEKTLEERFTQEFDPATNSYKEVSIGKMTDRQYLDYTIEQNRQYQRQDIEYQLQAYQKESMNGWEKFGHSFGQVLAEFGEGVISATTGLLDIFGALGYSIYRAGATQGQELFTDSLVTYFGEIGLTAMERESVRASLDEWERRYGLIKKIDGSSTSLGGALASISNSFGMMIPGIAIGAITGGAGIPLVLGAKVPLGFTAFYASMFSGNMYENAVNQKLEKNPSFSLVLNAALKTTSQAVIEWGLGKILGGTIGNSLLGLGSRGALKSAVKIGKGAAARYLLKQAGQEGLEEFLQDMGDMLIDTTFSWFRDGYTRGIDFQQLMDSFIIGAASSLLLAGFSVGSQEIRSAVTHGNNKFDIFYTKDGQTKKVRGFSRLIWRDMLNTLNENIDAIRAGTLSEKATIRTLEAIGVTYETLGQYFDGISQERVTKAIELLKSFSDYNALYDKYQDKANRIVSTARVLNPEVTPDLDRARAIVSESVEQERQTMKSLVVSQISADISRVMIDAKNDYITNAIKTAIKENADTLVDNNVTTVNRVIKDGETIGENDDSPYVQQKRAQRKQKVARANEEVESIWQRSQATVDELSKEYEYIFATDGHVALEVETDRAKAKKALLAPEAWLENYTPTQIKEFLVQADVIKTFTTDPLYKPIYEAMRDAYKDFTGVDLRKGDVRGAERVILDTLFNEAVFQNFLLKNIHKFETDNNINILFTLAGLVQDLGKKYAKKYKNRNTLLDKVYEKIKETMRKPILKAVINWQLDPQISGADEVLTPRDMEFINARKARDAVILTGEERSAYAHTREQILGAFPLTNKIRELVKKGSERNATEKDKLIARAILDIFDNMLGGDIDLRDDIRRNLNALDEAIPQLRYSPSKSINDIFISLTDIFYFIPYEYNKNFREMDNLGDTILTDLQSLSDTLESKKLFPFSKTELASDETGEIISTSELPEIDVLFTELETLIPRFRELLSQILNNIPLTEGESKHLLVIPAEACSIGGISDTQHYADVINKFVDTFGISPQELYLTPDNEIRTRGINYNRLMQAKEATDYRTNETIILSNQEFVIQHLRSMLGDGYSVFRTPEGRLKVVKFLHASELFNTAVLEGNVSSLVYHDNGITPLPESINDGEVPIFDLLSDDVKATMTKLGHEKSLKNIDVIFNVPLPEKGARGATIITPNGKNYSGVILITDESKKTLYHEIGHVFQHLFNLPTGGGPELFGGKNFNANLKREIFNTYRVIFSDIFRLKDADTYDDLKNFSDAYQDDANEKINYVLYLLLFGEIWSRQYAHNENVYGYIVRQSKTGYVVSSPISGKTRTLEVDASLMIENRLFISSSIEKTSSTVPDSYQVNSIEEAFIKALEAHDARYMNENTNTNYHSAFTGRTSELLDDLLSDSLPITTRRLVSIDQVIRKPQDYLKKSILDKMPDKSEGGVYRFLQNYFFKQGSGYNIDIHKKTHQYVFVNDSAFADIATPEMSEAIDADDDYDFVEAHTDKTNKLSDFIDKKALRQLNIPVDIDVVISTNKDALNETQFNDKHKNGIIYLKTDDYTTNAELAMKIMHEFRHVLQHYNFLEGGFTNDFKVSPELLADVKKYYPGLFTNKIIRDRFKTDERIVQQFVYWQISGEQNAFAFNPNILFGKPWFATHEAGKGVLYAPWYGKNADGSYSGIYQVEIAARMADITDESAPESKAKGHKLTERGSALPYKGKGKRKVVSEETVGEPSVKINKRTGKKTIIPNMRKTVIYEYDTKGIGLSQKRANKVINGQTSNLHYFLKKGKNVSMPADMQDFIEATTGNESKLPSGLVRHIKNGTLTKSELMAWFRSVDLSDDAKINDFTFDLLNKYFFKNDYITSRQELIQLVDQDISQWYAAYWAIRKSGADYDFLLRENSLEGFLNFVSTVANSAFKADYDKVLEEFEHIDESYGNTKIEKDVDLEVRQYMRVATMLRFDGTLQNAMLLARDFRHFTKFFADRVLRRIGTSLNAEQDGQNKGAGHGGESGKGRSLEETYADETYIKNVRDALPEEIVKALAEQEYKNNYGEGAEEDITKALKRLKLKNVPVKEKFKLLNNITAVVKRTVQKLATKRKNANHDNDIDFIEMMPGSIDQSTEEEIIFSEMTDKEIDSHYDFKFLDFKDAIEDYVKGTKSIDEVLNIFENIIVEYYSTKYAGKRIEELNARYDAAWLNTLLPDDMQIDVFSETTWSRRDTQANIKTRVRQLNQMVRKGLIVWETLPKDVQDMFVVQSYGKGRNKIEYYALKDEYYRVDTSRKDDSRFTQVKATLDVLNEIHSLAKQNAFLKTEAAEQMRKNLLSLQRSLREKQRKLAKTEQKVKSIEFTYKKKASEAKTSTQKNAARRVDVITTVNSQVELPEKLVTLFSTGFEAMADTQVQFASKDADGKLYEKGDADFQSRLQHEVISWNTFYDANRETFKSFTRDDVLDIVDAIQQGIWAADDLDSQRKVLAFQIFVLGYIYDGTRGNQMLWNLSNDEIESIRETYEKLASIVGTGLNAVGQMTSTVNPVKRVQQRLWEDWGIEPEQSEPIFQSIERLINAKDQEAYQEEGETLARLLGEVEGLMAKHQQEEHDKSRKQRKAEQDALRKKWRADVDLYKVEHKRWLARKNAGEDNIGPEPQYPKKPRKLQEGFTESNFYKGLMNWRYTSMLSSPATWVRNLVSNVMLSGINRAADAVANVVFDIVGKGYRKDQWDLSNRTKVSQEVNDYVDNLVNSITYVVEEIDKKGNVHREERKLFDLLYDGTSKYSDRLRLRTGADLFSAFVTQAIEAKHAATHRFDNPALNRVANFVSDRIKDTRFIKAAANRYFKKILQLEIQNGNIDISKPISREVLDLFAEAVILASQDFMHKESALGAMMNSLREKRPKAYAVMNFFFPFMNVSFNWFTEAFKLSPFGLAKAIWNSAHLEDAIYKVDSQRAEGRILPSTKAVQYLTRRDVGKGIIGTILWGLGAILAATDIIRLDDEDDKQYIFIGDAKFDISDIFGSSSLLVGAALVNFAAKDDKTFDDVMDAAFNLLLDGFIAKDLWENFRWSNGMYELFLTQTESILKSFIPQFIQLLVRASNNHNITYSPGTLGMIQRWLNSFVPTMPLGDKRVNPYTGELESKYAIPFVGEILRSGLFGVRVVWSSVTDGEQLAKEYNVNKNMIEAEITIDGQKVSLGDKGQLNQYYGRLNAASLSELQNKSHLVEMTDGSYKTLSWNDMNDKQRQNVIERTFTKNASYAKIYIWTQVLGHKYYTNQETRTVLRELGITSNVYLGDKGYVE
mgnify:CR=1 FL=1